MCLRRCTFNALSHCSDPWLRLSWLMTSRSFSKERFDNCNFCLSLSLFISETGFGNKGGGCYFILDSFSFLTQDIFFVASWIYTYRFLFIFFFVAHITWPLNSVPLLNSIHQMADLIRLPRSIL